MKTRPLGKASREKPIPWHEDNGADVSVSSKSLLVGMKRFSKKQIVKMLERGKGTFHCYIPYQWHIAKNGTVQITYGYDRVGSMILSHVLVQKIRKWAREKP